MTQAELQELKELEELERLEKMAAQSGSVPAAQPEVIDEMHPEISTLDRLKLKNFANSNESMIKYLKQKNPYMDIQEMNGEIVMKAPGEANYRKLDPNAMTVGEFFRDAGDIVYDVGDAIGTGLATAGGAIGGTFIAPGVGTVGGGVAAGAASSAASEAARQGIGKALGINDEVDMTDVALSGAVGAASPLLFGTGASVKGTAKAALKANAGGKTAQQTLRKALGMNAAEQLTRRQALEMADKTGKGLAGIGWDYTKNEIAPGVAGFLSGKGKQSIKDMAKNIDEIDGVQRAGSLDTTVEDYAKKFGRDFDDKLSETGERLSQAIDSAGKKVNLSGAKNPFRMNQEKLEKFKTEADTPVLRAQIDRIRRAYNGIFGNAEAGERQIVGERVVPGQTYEVVPEKDIYGVVTNPNQVEQRTKNVFIPGNQSTVENSVDHLGVVTSPGRTINTPGQSVQVTEFGPRVHRTPDQVAQIVDDKAGYFDPVTMNYVTRSPEIADEVSGSTAWKIQQDLKRLRRLDPMEGVKTSDGVAVDDAMVRDAANQGYHTINDGLMAATDGVSKQLKDQYSNLANLERRLEPYFSDPKKTLRTLRSMDKRGYEFAKKDLQRASDAGVKSAGEANKMMSLAQWVNPEVKGPLMNSIPAVGAGAAVGYWAGANSGMGQGLAGPGGLAGGGLGYFLAGPKAMKFYTRNAVKMNKAAGNAIQKANQVTSKTGMKQGKKPAVAKGIYDLMKDEEDSNN